MLIINGSQMCELVRRTLNHVDARLVDHGIRVAYIVSRMLEKQNTYSQKDRQDLCFLALLHDIGAYKTEEIEQMVQFETENIWSHSIYGSLFIRYFSPLKRFAPVILFHHLNYDQLDRLQGEDAACRELAQIINLADRADVFRQCVGSDKAALKDYLNCHKGQKYDCRLVELFWETDDCFHIWEHLDEPITFQEILGEMELSRQEIDQYLKMLIFTIDFRSSHTVTHTATTTHIGWRLAQCMKLEETEQQQIYYGGMLHDLGKIGIPIEILEFPGKLSAQAMTIMRTHVDLTAEILGKNVEQSIANISLRHHEKLDGSGYPKGLTSEDLSLSQRIVAVADIASALSVRRSYKEAFPKQKTLGILSDMSGNGQIDRDVVNTLTDRYDTIMEQVQQACEPVLRNYALIQSEYGDMLERYSCI